ncbi:MAG: PD-(D/E)XK nuclease family protein [Phycisphaerae bacterium]
MSVQFILGRAGTGKTEQILAQLAAGSEARPLGPPIFWLVPTQATFITQRRLMDRLSSTARVEVLGPRRFCQRLAAQMGQAVPQVLSPARRLLALGRAVEAVEDKLGYFKPSLKMPGFLRTLDATLQQLVREGQTAEDLRRAAEAIVDYGHNHLGAKLRDLALLVEAWNGVLSSVRFDPDQLPQWVRSLLPDHHHKLAGISIYVDALSSMGTGEIELLADLASHSCRVVMSLLLDPALADAREPPSGNVFRPTLNLYRRINAQLKKVGAVIDPPVLLREVRRFESPALAALESQLAGVAAVAVAAPAGGATGADIRIHLLPDPVAEGAFIARNIRRMVAGGMRYRQIGIITNAIDQYESVFEQLFPLYGIPFFIDRQKPVTLHPMTVAARALLRLGERGGEFADILQFLRSGLTGCSPADIDEFENFALAYAMTRRSLEQHWSAAMSPASGRLRNAEPREAAANRVRAALLRILQPWLTTCANDDFTGEAWVKAFGDILLSPVALNGLGAMADEALAAGDAQASQLHSAMPVQLRELLEAAAAEFHGRRMTYGRFAGLMSTLLDSLTLRVIPPTTDQVLVTSAQRSRHPEFDVVFLAGFRDGQFPLISDESLLLSPADRQRAKDVLPGVFTLPEEQVLAAPFFDYVAMTRASDRLIMTRPRLDGAGNRTAPSVYESELVESGAAVVISEGDEETLGIADLASRHDAIMYAARQAAIDEGRRSADAAAFQQWLADRAPETLRSQWLALEARLSPQSIAPMDRRLIVNGANQINVSFSSLETYAECPLKHYFKYILHLSPREEWQVDAMEIGSVGHSVLEAIFNDIIKGRGPLVRWPAVSEADIRAAIDDQFATIGMTAMAQEESPELRPLLTLLKSNLLAMLAYQAELAEALRLRPLATEHRFSVPIAQLAEGLESGIATTGDLSAVMLEGKIDRLDGISSGSDGARNLIIFDYKSSKNRINWNQMRAGTELQLLGYLLVSAYLPEFAGSVGIGAFYQPLKPQPAKQAATDESDDSQAAPNVMVGGVLSWDTNAPPKLERLLGAGTKKMGGHRADSPLKTSAQVQGYKLMVLDRTVELVHDIMDGVIAPAPIRLSSNETACDRCDFKACCPFDRIRGQYRSVKAVAAAAQEVHA